MNSPSRAERFWTELPPAAGAAVMATGIVSVGLHLIHVEWLSAVLLCLAAAEWILLAADFATRATRETGRWLREAVTPPALTGVAATSVLGTRIALLGWRWLAIMLLVVALAAWPGLLMAVLRHRRSRMPGAFFLICVSTQGLSVLAATLRTTVLDWAALVFFCLGLVLYGLALTHFDLRQVAGGAGDQWIACGGLAISALAGSKLVATGTFTGWPHTTLRMVTQAVLALCVAWYVILLVAEVRRPRLQYDIRRWATVFPLGMTAVACLSVAAVEQLDGLHTLGVVLLWFAFAAWAFTAAMLGGVLLRQR